MNLLRTALRRPTTVLVLVAAIAVAAWLAVRAMTVDVFPALNLPVIYVAQPYGGMSPAQMEGYLVNYYEYHFLYIAGIQRVESRSIQSVGLIKLVFYPGTDMTQALAQTISYVDRARAFMPAGTVPPFVMRFDAGSVPVGQLVFSSPSRGVGEISDLALFRVRPLFATLPGVSAPPPFGGNQRTIVIRVSPDKLRQYHLSPEAVAEAVAQGNRVLPAGNIRIGTLNRMVPVNGVAQDLHSLDLLPLHPGSGPAVLLRDVATVQDDTDLPTDYALFQGHRTVYIPITKRADASTLQVVNEIKASLPRFQAVLPPDVQVRFAFDQSGYVTDALSSLLREIFLGIFLTGLVVYLFLSDWRSSLIVVVVIPLAILASLVALWFSHQSINIMTLGGLALAVGILVDEATVVMENTHVHLQREPHLATAVLHAGAEVIRPRLLAMLAVIAVFLPAFFMTGISRSLFLPLALAVAFCMAASFVLSSTLVPVLSVWLLKLHPAASESRFERFRERYHRWLAVAFTRRRWVLALYGIACVVVVGYLAQKLPRQMFPAAQRRQFSIRLRAPTGTRLRETERLTKALLDRVKRIAGPGQVETTLALVGTQPPAYPINTIFLWTSGPQEAVVQIALSPQSHWQPDQLEEVLRQQLPASFPGCTFSMEAGDVIDQVLNFGASAPVQVAVRGPNFTADQAYASRVMQRMQTMAGLRDLHYEEPLHYPTLDVQVDRERAGQLGLDVNRIGLSLVTATSSSRYVLPNYWADPKSGVGYQVQVEVPTAQLDSVSALQSLPVSDAGPVGAPPVLLGDVAKLSLGNIPGEYDRYNMQRTVAIDANLFGLDLGHAANALARTLQEMPPPPRGVTVQVAGQVPVLNATVDALRLGLGLAVLAIFFLMAAQFESLRLAMAILLVIPGALTGTLLMLWLTHASLNMQSFMGAIMAVGVVVANAILLVTFAEHERRRGTPVREAAESAALQRLRPILMTSLTMMAGMLPLAIGLGRGGEQSAPLGQAVLGGLLGATPATLLILPLLFYLFQGRVQGVSNSLDPNDPDSSHFRPDLHTPKEGTA